MNNINSDLIESLYNHIEKYHLRLRSFHPSKISIEEAVNALLEKGEMEFLVTIPENDLITLFLLNFNEVNDQILPIIRKSKLRSSIKNINNECIAKIIYDFRDINNRSYFVDYLPSHKKRRWSAILLNDSRVVESFNKDLIQAKGHLESLEKTKNNITLEINDLSATSKKLDKDNFEKSLTYSDYESQVKTYEEMILDKQAEIQSLEAKKQSFNKSIKEREEEIKRKEDLINEENQKLLKNKLEQSLPGYINKTENLLTEKEVFFNKMGARWSYIGIISVIISIYCGVFYTIYSFDFLNSNSNLEWKYLLLNVFKGGLVVGIFLYIAQHAFNVSNAYVHESIQRSDKRHAINFGELFLKIYGSSLQRDELLKVFENWNISTDSAFKKIQHASMSKEFASLLSNLKPEFGGKDKKSDAD